MRIEDLDPPREAPGAARDIVETLAAFGMESDEAVEYQSRRGALYEAAFARLLQSACVYGCACSRADIEEALAAVGVAGVNATVYPGTCRAGLGVERFAPGDFAFPPQRWGSATASSAISNSASNCDVGDFVVRRADGLWAYQLAVVVDDDTQRITDVVRGADLLDNTPRQIALQRALGLATTRYMHVGIVINERGEKLSKQTGAQALDRDDILGELECAANHLGLPQIGAASADAFLRSATSAWAERCSEPSRRPSAPHATTLATAAVSCFA